MVTIAKPTLKDHAQNGNLSLPAISGEHLTGRQNNVLFDMLFGGNYGIFLAEGNFWREQRRFVMKVLRDFGFGRNLMEQKIHQDIDRLLEYIDGGFGSRFAANY